MIKIIYEVEYLFWAPPRASEVARKVRDPDV
jgi:hypothetical protein